MKKCRTRIIVLCELRVWGSPLSVWFSSWCVADFFKISHYFVKWSERRFSGSSSVRAGTSLQQNSKKKNQNTVVIVLTGLRKLSWGNSIKLLVSGRKKKKKSRQFWWRIYQDGYVILKHIFVWDLLDVLKNAELYLTLNPDSSCLRNQ